MSTSGVFYIILCNKELNLYFCPLTNQYLLYKNSGLYKDNFFIEIIGYKKCKWKILKFDMFSIIFGKKSKIAKIISQNSGFFWGNGIKLIC